MKKLTQILRIWHTANFWNETNKDGKNLSLGALSNISFEPIPSLKNTLIALGGHLSNTTHGIQVYLPFDFTNGLVNSQVAHNLPSQLQFFIIGEQPQNLLFSGLDFSKKLFVTTTANSAAYNLNATTITANILGDAAPITLASQHPFISNFSHGFFQKLIGQPLGLGAAVFDLKVQSGADIFTISTEAEFALFQKFLAKNLFKIIPLNIKRASNNSLIINFPTLLVLPENSPKNTIGLITIPKASLILNENNQANYQKINNFILHLPQAKIKLDISLTTNVFVAGSKLFLDTVDLNPTENPVVGKPGFKILTKTLNNYELYLQASRRLMVQKADKKIAIEINPIGSLNFITKSAQINISKTI